MTETVAIKTIKAERKDGSFEQTWGKRSRSIDYKWIISGDTYDYRRTLRRCGLDYNGDEKTWHWNEEELPEAVQSLIDVLDTVTADAGDAPAPPLFEPPAANPPQVVETEKVVYKNLTYRSKHRRPNARQWQRIKPTPKKNPDDIIKPSYWDRLMRYLTPGRSRPAIALVGPTGNGKTTVAEAACQVLGIDYIVIDCNDRMEAADLIGAMTYHPDSGEVWRDGPVTRAFREGKAVILNEYDTLDPRTGMSLQSAFQDGGPNKKSRYITLSGNPDEDRVYPAGDCPLILTMNTYGNGASRQYTGRNTLDAANLDRISVIVTHYENEEQILQAKGFSKDTAKAVVLWARNMRDRIEKEMLRVTVSNRLTQFIAQSIEWDGLDFEQAVQEEFFEQIDPADAALLMPRRFGRASA